MSVNEQSNISNIFIGMCKSFISHYLREREREGGEMHIMNRKRVKQLFLTDLEYARMEKLAKKHEINASQLLRKLLKEAA